LGSLGFCEGDENLWLVMPLVSVRRVAQSWADCVSAQDLVLLAAALECDWHKTCAIAIAIAIATWSLEIPRF
jgi:hypothetical protein